MKFQGHKGQISLILSGIEFSGLSFQFEFTDGFEMIYKAWSSIEEVPYCLSGSSIKFQGHTGQKIAKFDPNWAFLDCNCSLNSPIKFEGHMDRKIDDLNPISSKITRLVAAIKSLRFALVTNKFHNSMWLLYNIKSCFSPTVKAIYKQCFSFPPNTPPTPDSITQGCQNNFADQIQLMINSTFTTPRVHLCMVPANERWCYSVTPSLIGWDQSQNDPCNSRQSLTWITSNSNHEWFSTT